ncbi:hypothetical protein ACJJIF_22000 (plasmid) [Microbulbifer sp. SSSA002]|uniref:hypothetical protein n=1 Tax=Microbulbifer sp. SSSA002 TaxID=3243376 RepID=UPI0040398737
MEVTFNAELKGSGAAGTPPEIAPLLRACGLAETITAGTSVEYNLASEGHESITLYLYEDGSLYKLTGVRGTWTPTAHYRRSGQSGLHPDRTRQRPHRCRLARCQLQRCRAAASDQYAVSRRRLRRSD